MHDTDDQINIIYVHYFSVILYLGKELIIE